MSNTEKMVVALCLGGAILAAALMPENKDAEIEAGLYAEMVCLGIATDMQYGWPNYKNLEVTCE